MNPASPGNALAVSQIGRGRIPVLRALQGGARSGAAFHFSRATDEAPRSFEDIYPIAVTPRQGGNALIMT
jgi:hypothetical protein